MTSLVSLMPKTSMETQEGIGDIEEKIVSMVYDGKVSQNNKMKITKSA